MRNWLPLYISSPLSVPTSSFPSSFTSSSRYSAGSLSPSSFSSSSSSLLLFFFSLLTSSFTPLLLYSFLFLLFLFPSFPPSCSFLYSSLHHQWFSYIPLSLIFHSFLSYLLCFFFSQSLTFLAVVRLPRATFVPILSYYCKHGNWRGYHEGKSRQGY